MSASRMPAFKPMAWKPSARLTAVVDLPTPPLPDATAIRCFTPGMACGARPEPEAICGGGALRAAAPSPAAPFSRASRTRGCSVTLLAAAFAAPLPPDARCSALPSTPRRAGDAGNIAHDPLGRLAQRLQLLGAMRPAP